MKELANGTRATMIYDAGNNLTRIANLKSDDSTISQYDYQYNAANKRTQITDATGAVTSYSYDNIYQLTREQRATPDTSWSDLTADGWSDLSIDGWSSLPADPPTTSTYDHQYQYDAVQNRTVKNINGALTTSTFDAANQLQYADSADGRTTYTFDQNGNQILEEEPNTDRTTTTYDYENQTSVIVLPTEIRNTMTYNPDQLRIKLEDSNGTTKFLWDGAAYLSELNETNTTKATFTQEPGGYGGLVSQYRKSGSLWLPSYYHYEDLGNTTALTDDSGNITDTYQYNAFGVLLSQTGTTTNPFQFGGYWGYHTDPDTKFLYIRARIYIPWQGRWTSVDILLFINGPNVYVAYFVPNGVDPSGTQDPFSSSWSGGYYNGPQYYPPYDVDANGNVGPAINPPPPPAPPAPKGSCVQGCEYEYGNCWTWATGIFIGCAAITSEAVPAFLFCVATYIREVNSCKKEANSCAKDCGCPEIFSNLL